MHLIRLILPPICLLACLIAHAQKNPIVGTWILPSGKSIRIDSLNTQDWSPRAAISNLTWDNISGSASIHKDILKITNVSWGTVNNKSVRRERVYGFLIQELTDSLLVVAPYTAMAKSYFPKQTLLRFHRQEFSADTSLHFCQLFFHTTGCLGTCPTFHLRVDDQQNIQFYAENIIMFDSTGTQRDDTARQGYYTGRLNDSLYQELVLAVQSACLRTLRIPDIMGYDGSVYTIIVYFGNQRKYMQTMFPPIVLVRLIEICYRICDENRLPKTNRQLSFDQ